MPTYQFRCPKGHDTDRFYKTMSSAPMELECPECGEPAARRLSGGAGLLFKGSGFYLTDYGKNAHRGSAPEKKSDSRGEPAKSDAPKADGKATAKSREQSAESGKPKADPGTPKAESGKPRTDSKPKSE